MVRPARTLSVIWGIKGIILRSGRRLFFLAGAVPGSEGEEAASFFLASLYSSLLIF